MIQERFKSLGVIDDWKRLNEINRLRNDLEHYYTKISSASVREVVSKSILLIRDFVSNELKQNPVAMFGEERWHSLLNVSDVYEKEELECKASLDEKGWEFSSVPELLKELRCKSCHSSLIFASGKEDIYPTINLTCRSCNFDFCFDEVIGKCVREALYGRAVRAAMDGGESPYDSCPECSDSTYIHEEECCIKCQYTQEYLNCDRCSDALTLDDQFLEGTYGYCQHQYERIMEE